MNNYHEQDIGYEGVGAGAGGMGGRSLFGDHGDEGRNIYTYIYIYSYISIYLYTYMYTSTFRFINIYKYVYEKICV
jgi:hypothetical protein